MRITPMLQETPPQKQIIKLLRLSEPFGKRFQPLNLGEGFDLWDFGHKPNLFCHRQGMWRPTSEGWRMHCTKGHLCEKSYGVKNPHFAN